MMELVKAYCCVGGELCPVTDMFDDLEEPTDRIEDAASAVYVLPDGNWYTTEVFPGLLYRPN